MAMDVIDYEIKGAEMQFVDAVFATLVQIASWADRMVPCLGIEVIRHRARVRFDRLPGESLEELHARANRGGSWRAHPTPIMGEPQIRQPLLHSQSAASR